MSLDDIITALEAADPRLVLPEGFTNPHSYRGYYEQLAFEPARNVTVAAMLADARSALGTVYEGYKGGSFRMHSHTDCWLAMYGCCSDDMLGPKLIAHMIAAGKLPEDEPAPVPATAEPIKIPRSDALHFLEAEKHAPEMHGLVFEAISGQGETRWMSQHWLILRRVADGALFASLFQQGLTENQSGDAWGAEPYDYEGGQEHAEFFPVTTAEKTVTTYAKAATGGTE